MKNLHERLKILESKNNGKPLTQTEIKDRKNLKKLLQHLTLNIILILLNSYSLKLKESKAYLMNISSLTTITPKEFSQLISVLSSKRQRWKV